MLGKLLKYEIPAMGRKLLPLYAAWAATALFLGLTTQSSDSKTEFMVVISALLYTAVATAIFVMTIILIVQRYSNSLLGDEAYLVAGPDFSIREMIHDLMNMQLEWPKHLGLYIVEVLIMVIASAVKTIMQIYAAITIGHQAQNRTTLASIGAYILILVFESIVGRMFIPLFAKIGFSEDEFLNFTMIFIVGVIAAAAFSAVYFFVCKYLMEKRLNLN